MSQKLVLALVATFLFAVAVAVDPTITPPPDLKNRQTSSTILGLIGYVNLGGYCKYIGIPVGLDQANPRFNATGSALSCGANYTFSEWVSWGRCCYVSTPGCDFVTSCDGDTMYGQVGSSTW
jgi:hypothetical protein